MAIWEIRYGGEVLIGPSLRGGGKESSLMEVYADDDQECIYL